jgi:hypothetical protein
MGLPKEGLEAEVKSYEVHAHVPKAKHVRVALHTH